MTRVPNDSIARVLVRVPNWLGDAVMCEPAIRAARDGFPRATITILARPAVAELLAGHPAVAQTIVYEHRGRHAGLAGKWALGRELRAGRYDAAILFQNAFEAAVLACLGTIPRRLGYATDGRGFLLTEAVPVPTQPAQQVHYYLDLLRATGWQGPVHAPRLYLRDDERTAMARRLTDAGVGAQEQLIGVNPGSTYGGAKRWLPERFAEAAVRLLERVRRQSATSARAVILGAAGEEALGEQIARQIGPDTLVWSGRTSIRELMAVTARCRLYLTNDTGPMHLAAAFGVPLVAVFGPTDWRTTAPFGDQHALVRQPVDCAPCLLRECPIDHRCMTGVTANHVVEAAERVLDATASTVPSGSSDLTGVTVYLDRDGTLIRDVGYLNDPARLEWLPGVVEGLARLRAAGARLVVVTNQSGIARGRVTPQQLTAIHARMTADLAGAGVRLSGLYLCPHHPDDGCACRKPQTGMVEQSRREAGAVPRWEYVIGDADRDIELGRRIGARTVRMAGSDQTRPAVVSDRTVSVFSDAVAWILEDAAQRRSP